MSAKFSIDDLLGALDDEQPAPSGALAAGPPSLALAAGPSAVASAARPPTAPEPLAAPEPAAAKPPPTTPAPTPAPGAAKATACRALALPTAAAGGGALALDVIREATGASRFMQIAQAPAYDAAEVRKTEHTEYAMALLEQSERDRLLEEPVMTTKAIQHFIQSNSPSRLFEDQSFVLEGDMVKEIDVRIREPVFITGNSRVYTREELLAAFPFDALGVVPEEAFAQQELGVFPAPGRPGHEDYVVRDLGATEPFVAPEDMVTGVITRQLKRVVKTKIFLARDGWDDFMTAVKQMRSMMRFGGAAIKRAEQSGQANMFALMARNMVAGAAGGAGGAPLALEGEQEREARLRRAEEEIARREERAAALEARAAELVAMLEGRGDLGAGGGIING